MLVACCFATSRGVLQAFQRRCSNERNPKPSEKSHSVPNLSPTICENPELPRRPYGGLATVRNLPPFHCPRVFPTSQVIPAGSRYGLNGASSGGVSDMMLESG